MIMIMSVQYINIHYSIFGGAHSYVPCARWLAARYHIRLRAPGFLRDGVRGEGRGGKLTRGSAGSSHSHDHGHYALWPHSHGHGLIIININYVIYPMTDDVVSVYACTRRASRVCRACVGLSKLADRKREREDRATARALFRRESRAARARGGRLRNAPVCARGSDVAREVYTTDGEGRESLTSYPQSHNPHTVTQIPKPKQDSL